MGLAKIKNNIDNLAKSNNVANQTLWDMFFFENFLNRLSNSKYKTKFIFKGGFLLGSIVGIEQRTTLDIDLKYVGITLDDKVLLNTFKEICEIDLNDEIKYEVIDIAEITKEKNIQVNLYELNLNTIIFKKYLILMLLKGILLHLILYCIIISLQLMECLSIS